MILLVADGDNERDSGDSEPIYWENYATKRRVNKVVDKYTKNGGKTWKKITTVPDDFDPSLMFWTVPTPGATKDKCRVKVIMKSTVGRNLGVATTEGWFSIVVP